MVAERAQIVLNRWTPLAEIAVGNEPLADQEILVEANNQLVTEVRFAPISGIRSLGRVPFLSYFYDGSDGRELGSSETYRLRETHESGVEFQAWAQRYGVYLKFQEEDGMNVLEKIESSPWFNLRTGHDNWGVILSDSGLSIAKTQLLVRELPNQEI